MSWREVHSFEKRSTNFTNNAASFHDFGTKNLFFPLASQDHSSSSLPSSTSLSLYSVFFLSLSLSPSLLLYLKNVSPLPDFFPSLSHSSQKLWWWVVHWISYQVVEEKLERGREWSWKWWWWPAHLRARKPLDTLLSLSLSLELWEYQRTG